MPLLRPIVALALMALVVAPRVALADAAEPVSVKVNMARVLKINAPAATIIVGNPGVADVTIQDPQTLILTGKSYGETNLIVLDSGGNAIADTVVEVVQAQSDVLTMYQGAKRQSMSCSPVCQPMIMLGDDNDYASQSAGGSATLQAMSAK